MDEQHDEQRLPSVYNYLDVKTFLSEYREIRKTFDHGFTHTYICYALGQTKSKGYFTNVVKGRVKIGSTLVERFIDLLEFDKNEADYFRYLVLYSQCAEIEERERLLKALVIRNRNSCVALCDKATPYYENWRYAVIRALLDIVDFDGDDLQFLIDKLLFKITKREIAKALAILEDTGLTYWNDDGFVKPTDATITPSTAIHRELLLQNQIQQFGFSQEIMLNPQARPQKVTTMTLSISETTYNDMKERIDALKEEIRSLARNEQGPAERLYQLNIHLFPQSI